MQIVTLVVTSFTWFMLAFMLYSESKVYVEEFRAYVRFGVFYVLVAETTMFRFITELREQYDTYVSIPFPFLIAYDPYVVPFICQA